MKYAAFPLFRSLSIVFRLIIVNLIAYLVYLSMFYESLFINKPLRSNKYVDKLKAVGTHAGLMAGIGAGGMVLFVILANIYSLGVNADQALGA